MPMLRALQPTLLAITLPLLGACGFPLPGDDQAIEPMDPERLLIAQVQGDGGESPVLGQEVAIEGIVTRSLAGDSDDLAQEFGETLGEGNRGKVVGWFVQDEGDGNDATSDALFVLDQSYVTGLNMPAESEYTMRLGTSVRSGDRVKVHGVVAELAQDIAAEQPRSAGHDVARGDPAGTITAINATSITLLSRRDRRQPIMLRDVTAAHAGEERSEGMRLAADAR